MGNKIMQETTPLVECSAFHRGMSVLEASLRNTEDSETIISGLLKGAAEFYGASRASVVEADWDLGIGVITYEWCKDGVSAQRDRIIKPAKTVQTPTAGVLFLWVCRDSRKAAQGVQPLVAAKPPMSVRGGSKRLSLCADKPSAERTHP